MKRKLASKKKLPMIDLYTPLKNHSALFSDGIHPNAKGATIMAATIANVLTGKAINKSVMTGSYMKLKYPFSIIRLRSKVLFLMNVFLFRTQ